MGKKLIIKGADFSANGIPASRVDVTDILLVDLIRKSTTRVSGGIIPISQLGASVGDTLEVVSPDKYYVAFECGPTDDDLDNYYWYGSDDNLINSYKGDVFTIPSDTSFIQVIFGKANEIYNGTTENITVNDIESLKASGTLSITLIRA